MESSSAAPSITSVQPNQLVRRLFRSAAKIAKETPGAFVKPAVQNESDIEAFAPLTQPVVQPQDGPVPVTYTVLQGASNLGKDVLVDSLGYRYARKVDYRRPSVTWRCYKRSRNFTCKATVMEKNGVFLCGSQHHVCTAQSGRKKVLLIRKEIKVRAVKRVFDSAANIVKEVLVEQTNLGELPVLPSLPRPVNLAQQANRKRQKTRRHDPRDPDYVLDSEKSERKTNSSTASHLPLEF